MPLRCSGPKHFGENQLELADRDRRVDVVVKTSWGDDDIRVDHTLPMAFCSFACLAEWATETAASHDGHYLREGEPA